MEPGIIETGLVVGFYSYVCLFWNQNFVEETKHFKILGCSICLMLLMSLHQIVPVIGRKAGEETGTSSQETQTSSQDNVYRSRSDPGLWCSLLIPMALTTNLLRQPDVNSGPVILAYIIVVLVLVRFNPSAVTQITCAGLLYWFREDFMSKDRPEQVVLVCLCVVVYHLLGRIPRAFPRSFTEGELAVCLQIVFIPLYPIVVIGCQALQRGVSIISLPTSLSIALMAFTGVLVGTLFVSVIRVNSGGMRFAVSYGLAFMCALVPLSIKLYGTPLLAYREVTHYLRGSRDRVNLILWWGFLVLVSLFITMVNQNKTTSSGSTRLRKVFHVLILGVYVPGLVTDASLLFAASWVALGCLVIGETVRLLQVPPLGSLLHRCYSVFLSSQDTGRLVLTPLYLLCGFSLPLWIHTFQWCDFSNMLPLFAGVLSVGIGDTMASVVGSAIGKHKVLGGQKTVEGTVASIISQLVFLYILDLILFGGAIHPQWLVVTGIVTVTSLLEASTSQIDNHVLPLFMYNLLLTLKS